MQITNSFIHFQEEVKIEKLGKVKEQTMITNSKSHTNSEPN